MTADIGERLRSTLVADVMHHGIVSCSPETPLHSIARMMDDFHIHSVAVLDFSGGPEEGARWGVISDLDLLQALSAGEMERSAKDVAATEVLAVGPGETVERALQLMAEHEVMHLIVLADGAVAGVIAGSDIVRLAAG